MPINNSLSGDETSIDTHISHNYGWSRCGEKITFTNDHTRIRYSVMCIIDCKKIIYKKIVKGSVNGEIFLDFIKETIKNLSPHS